MGRVSSQSRNKQSKKTRLSSSRAVEEKVKVASRKPIDEPNQTAEDDEET